MQDFKSDELGAPKIVNRSTFQSELDALRVPEKAHTREGDAIAAARRRLPMVQVDGATSLIGERGAVTCYLNGALIFALMARRRSHHEGIQPRGLPDYFSLLAGLYVFRPSSFGTLDWNIDRRNLFYLLLVSWRVVFGRCAPFRHRARFTRL